MVGVVLLVRLISVWFFGFFFSSFGGCGMCLSMDWTRFGVDNTNRDRKTRECYMEVAKKFGVPVRYVSSFPSPQIHLLLTTIF